MQNVRALFLSLSCLCAVSVAPANADDSCSAQDVLYPMLQAGSELANCNVDLTTILTPDALLQLVKDQCTVKFTGTRCSKCLTKKGSSLAKGLAGLVKLGAFDAANLAAFKAGVAGLTCAPDPSPTPTPTPNAGSNEDIGRQIRDNTCPCNNFSSHNEYVTCISHALEQAVTQNGLNREVAADLFRDALRSSCSGVPTPTPSGTPRPAPNNDAAAAYSAATHDCPCNAQGELQRDWVRCGLGHLEDLVEHGTFSRTAAQTAVQQILAQHCGILGDEPHPSPTPTPSGH
ncbi:MAG: hypothetical protein U0136_20865 [Bdellovibrionota bacterium]